jgi:hypothetical protein
MKKKQVWHPKDKPDESGRSAHICMVCFLPNELMASATQIVQKEVLPDMDEAKQFGLMAQLVLAKQGQESAHKTAVLKRVRQWESIDQDVY